MLNKLIVVSFVLNLLMIPTSSIAAPIIRINVDALPITLDPPLLTDSIASWVLHHVAERLVEEHRPGQLQGNLARRWKIADDKKGYCFEIADGHEFSDGSPVTPKSIADSIRRSMNKRSASRVGFYLENIKSIKVSGQNEVCLTLKKPAVNFLQILADASFSISKEKDGGKSLIYSGQYLIGPRSGASLDLIRKKDGQTFRLEPLPVEKALERFRAQTLEIFRNSGTGGLDEVFSLGCNRATMPDERSFFFAFNLRSPIFSKIENRQNLLRSIHWRELAKELERHHLRLSGSLLSPTLFQAGSDDFVAPNLESAKNLALPEITLLTQSGFKLGGFVSKALAGVKIKRKDLAKPQFLKALKEGDFDLLFTGYGITVRDWDYISTLLHSSSAHNMIFLNDPKIDDLLRKARESELPQERLSIYKSVLKENYAAGWYIPVTHSPLVFCFADRVKTPFSNQNEIILSPWFRFDGIEWKK